MPPENYDPNSVTLFPNAPLAYLTANELPVYASMVTVPQAMQDSIIQRASLMISARYKRTGEIQQIYHEIVEFGQDNISHLMYTPIVLITNSQGFDILDASNGDTVEVRYSATMYPYAAIFGAPVWQDITPNLNTIDIMPTLGRIWVPPGIFPIPFSEARVTYRAGYCPIGGPYPEWLKAGCGMLIENIMNRSGSTMVQKGQVADQQQVQYFDNSFFNAELDTILAPLKVWSWR